MNDLPLEVRIVERITNTGQDLGQLLRREHDRITCQSQVRERLAFDEFHRDERLPVVDAHFVNLDDVGMAQAPRGHSLEAEPPEIVVVGKRTQQQKLEGHEAVEAALAGLVDDPHPTARNLLQQFIVAELALILRHQRRPGCFRRGRIHRALQETAGAQDVDKGRPTGCPLFLSASIRIGRRFHEPEPPAAGDRAARSIATPYLDKE